VPTFNEAGNAVALIAALDIALAGIRSEIIFVDDWSQDGTAACIAEVARHRPDLRVIRRYNRRGLSSAVIEGMMATNAAVVAVIDGDGQHDERLLPSLFDAICSDRADVAIGSRYCQEGLTESWDDRRRALSRIATGLSRLLLRSTVADPMSGFFAIRRETVEALLPHLSNRGFKILFDLLSSSPRPLRTVELPFEFRARTVGESKLGPGIVVDYAVMIVDRLIRRYVPSRFAMFALVGTVGLGVHFIMLRALLGIGAEPGAAEAGAIMAAIAFNFLANNSITFRDRKLRGARFLGGLASFFGLCGLGAIANLGAGAMLFGGTRSGWASSIAAAVVGSLWNYAAATLVTWRRR